MPNDKSSSAKRTNGAAPAQTSRKRDATPTDQDAADAIAFARRGRPEPEIGYSDDAPRLTDEQPAEFTPASFRVVAP